jgi:hypothetical protein
MTKTYYEAHVTMLGQPNDLAPIVRETGWRFSAIDGDANLGDGVKCYATRQFNSRIPQDEMVRILHATADDLVEKGAQVLRRKVEIVIYDDRSALVRPCSGGCVECHADDLPEYGKTAQ